MRRTRRARSAGCIVFDLDFGAHRVDADRLYMRERFAITAFRFTHPLG